VLGVPEARRRWRFKTSYQEADQAVASDQAGDKCGEFREAMMMTQLLNEAMR